MNAPEIGEMCAASGVDVVRNVVPINRFTYMKAGLDFASELASKIGNGESILLLGPRYSGKSALISQIEQILGGRPGTFVASVKLRERASEKGTSLCAKFLDVLGEKLRDFPKRENAIGQILAEDIVEYLKRSDIHLVLVATDVDMLPDRLARELLKCVRYIIQHSALMLGRFCVILTGSTGLGPLVTGPNSEFNCACQYVIQGFAYNAFSEWVKRYLAVHGWSLQSSDTDTSMLYDLTGGNISALRTLLALMAERRRILGIAPDVPIDVREIEDTRTYLDLRGDVFLESWRHNFVRVENSREALVCLARLLNETSIPIPKSSYGDDPAAPTALELSGLGIRKHNELRFASPIIEQLIRKYFNSRRLGDLFACEHEWETAFTYYAKAAAADESGVYSPALRPELTSVIAAFQAALIGRDALGIDGLRRFFSQGATHILGFDEVYFWEFNDEWDLLAGSVGFNEDFVDLWKKSLGDPRSSNKDNDNHALSGDTFAFGVHTLIPVVLPIGGSRYLAVALSNLSRRTPLTRERRILAERAVRHFAIAIDQASRIAAAARTSQVREHLLNTIPAVLGALEKEPTSVISALQLVGERLREIGYRRVMFSLVNPEETHIEGVFDSRANSLVDVAKRTSWSLIDPPADIQPHCVRMKSSISVKDARFHPLTNKVVVKEADIRAFVLIPMKRRENVIGTIHVERDDRTELPAEEIAALEYFAGLLATILLHVQQVGMLEASSMEEVTPSIIIDTQGTIRFVNNTAAKMMQLKPGWQSVVARAPATDLNLLPSHAEAIHHDTLKTETPHSEYLRDVSENGDRSFHAILASPIHNWQQKCVGTVLKTIDLSVLGNMIEVFGRMVVCPRVEQIVDALIDGTKLLGYATGRLYKCDQATGDLIGVRQYGFPEGTEGHEDFSNQTVRLARRDGVGSKTWRCFDETRPVVHVYNPSRKNGELLYTQMGIPAVNYLLGPQCPTALKKRAGDMWIDVPIFSVDNRTPLYKMSLQWQPSFGPDRLELLSLLSDFTAALIKGAMLREEIYQKQDDYQREADVRAARRAIGIATHRILGKLSALGLLKVAFDQGVSNREDFIPLVERFGKLLSDLSGSLEAIKSDLQPIIPVFSAVEIVPAIKSALEEVVSGPQFEILSENDQLTLDLDERLIKWVFVQLAQNSLEAFDGPLALQVRIFKRSSDKGYLWRIEFKDNGPGIHTSNPEEVFEELYTCKPNSKKSSGLGLSIVRQIINAHGGAISVLPCDSGALFAIELPAGRRTLVSKESAV